MHVPDEPEALDDLEEQLKRDNPKGRLWERCAQLHVGYPQIRHATSSIRHRVEMSLHFDEWELVSGTHWASSRKLAEQLAARSLLGELEDVEHERSPEPDTTADASDDIFDVDESEAEQLRDSNPKGQVFEWCQRQAPPVRRPAFEQRAVGAGVTVRARLATLDLASPWFRAAQRKTAEQAAAAALLPLLPTRTDTPKPEPTIPTNPRSALNEMVQRDRLTNCQFESAGRRGPPHEPIFSVVARATLPNGVTAQRL